jgi:hypothetical protein
MTEIKNVIRQENIEFLIVNNYFAPNIVNIKSTGTKIIGVYHGVFFSSMFNKLSKLKICFSNRFKKGGSSYDMLFSFKITIILKSLFIKENGFQRPNDIRVKYLLSIFVKS